MRQVGIAEAESGLRTLIDLVGQGEEVTIIRDGTPVAVLIPASPRSDKDAAPKAH